jgi:hypothetical protein
MNNDFDPYDILISTAERVNRLEAAHNKMAESYSKTEKEFTIALHSIRHLQQSYLEILSQQIQNAQKNK